MIITVALPLLSFLSLPPSASLTSFKMGPRTLFQKLEYLYLEIRNENALAQDAPEATPRELDAPRASED